LKPLRRAGAVRLLVLKPAFGFACRAPPAA
jgi:hypothetical protein